MAVESGRGVDERARLFVALELPEAVRAALVAWQERVLPERQGLRAVAPESLHVTLCFLGWQPASAAGAIATAVRQAVAGFPAPSLGIGRSAWLPRRRPRVLAVELADAQDVLGELQAALSEHLSAGHWYRAEQRRFRPHVTVARVGRSAPVASGALPPPGELADPPRAAFTGMRVTLYRSRLRPTGAEYQALGSVALGDSPPPRVAGAS